MNKDYIIDHTEEDEYYNDEDQVIFDHGYYSGVVIGPIWGLAIGIALGVFISYYYF